MLPVTVKFPLTIKSSADSAVDAYDAVPNNEPVNEAAITLAGYDVVPFSPKIQLPPDVLIVTSWLVIITDDD